MAKIWAINMKYRGTKLGKTVQENHSNKYDYEGPVEYYGDVQKRLTPDFGLGRGYTGEMSNKIELLKSLG